MNETSASHARHVRDFFERPSGYFGRRGFDVRMRVDAVRAFTADAALGEILDIGCGNGEITLPLLDVHAGARLTLLDLSSTMLELAKARVKAASRDRVAFINDDFMTIDFERRRFDLIVCVGVLAHADDPESLIARMVALLNPGGRLVLEVTDSFHPIGRALVIYHALLSRFRRPGYALNKLRIADISSACIACGLVPTGTYRYCLPPPGSQRVFSHAALHRAIRAVFGSPGRNRFGWMGNVALSRFTRPV